MKAGGRKIRSEVHKLINYILNKEEFPQQWKEPIAVPIYKRGDKTVCSNYQGISLLFKHIRTLNQRPALKGHFTMHSKSFAVINVDLDVTGQPPPPQTHTHTLSLSLSLHSSHTWKEIEIQRGSASTICYKLRESL
jgi:hypothetical protein